MSDKLYQQIPVPQALEEEEEVDLFDYYYDEPGSLPGTLNIEEDADPPTLVLIDYNEANATRIKLLNPEDCLPYLDSESVSWIDVQGLGSEDVLQRLGKVFHLHPLILEDIVNVPQRSKIEDYKDQLVIIAQMAMLNDQEDSFWIEQVSFVVGQHYLLTVQEEPEHDSFEPVRQRIRHNRGTIRKQGVDYLIYALLDGIIDGFFPILEVYGERIDQLEDEVVTNPTRKTLEKIYRIRRELLALRRCIWPQRETCSKLMRDISPLIRPDVQIYLRDCYDHTIQVIDIIETYRELTSGLMDVYLSSVSNKMNEIMKLLTVISSIFIPLTFIVGVYGMNFDPDASPWNMPELDWYFGYPACWALMIATAGGLVYFFWKRGWFENVSSLKDE